MQTVSLELSKKLAEAGLRIETEKWWADTTTDRRRGNDKLEGLHNWGLIDSSCAKSRICNGDKFVFRAYQTDELLALMPATISNNEYVSHLRISKNEHLDTIYVEYPIIFNTNDTPFGYEDKNPAEALGQMCLYLLENGWRWEEKEKCLRKE